MLVDTSFIYVVGRLTRAVDLGHHEPSEDGLVEGSIGTACDSAVSTHDARSAERRLTSQELVEAD